MFHNGADTISRFSLYHGGRDTILDETIQGFFDEEVCVEEDQSETNGKRIIARSGFNSLADSFLVIKSRLGSPIPVLSAVEHRSFQEGVVPRRNPIHLTLVPGSGLQAVPFALSLA